MNDYRYSQLVIFIGVLLFSSFKVFSLVDKFKLINLGDHNHASNFFPFRVHYVINISNEISMVNIIKCFSPSDKSELNLEFCLS